MKRAIFTLSVFLLSGCATVFSGSTQTINVEAIDSANHHVLDGVSCVVIEPNGVRQVVSSNPGTVSVTRGSGALNVACKKEGYHQLSTAVGDSFNSTTLVNILFWPGFFVDMASGANKKYPSHYVANMEKTSGAVAPVTPNAAAPSAAAPSANNVTVIVNHAPSVAPATPVAPAVSK